MRNMYKKHVKIISYLIVIGTPWVIGVHGVIPLTPDTHSFPSAGFLPLNSLLFKAGHTPFGKYNPIDYKTSTVVMGIGGEFVCVISGILACISVSGIAVAQLRQVRFDKMG